MKNYCFSKKTSLFPDFYLILEMFGNSIKCKKNMTPPPKKKKPPTHLR